MKTVILCGGAGTRLQAEIKDRPKPMAEVAERPFLEWLLLSLHREGVRDVILATGHLGDVIEQYLAGGARVGINITYSRDPEPLGTAGAIRHAVGDANSDQALVLNGDSYAPLDLTRLRKSHFSRKAMASLWLVRVPDASRYGWVELSQDGRVTAFREKAAGVGGKLISAGIYLLEPEAIEMIAVDRPSSVETELFPRLTKFGLFGVIGDGIFVDIGTPESYRNATELMSRESKWIDGDSAGDDRLKRVQQHLTASAAIQNMTAAQSASSILEAADTIVAAFRIGRKVLLCGNGGSAADCQHMAAELVSLLTKDFQRPGLAALALTTDTSFLTAYANDFGFEGVFERQVQALGQPGDVLIAISTSGRSANVRRAVSAARTMGIRTVGLLGEGGELSKEVECPIVIPSRSTHLVQEALLPVEHAICDLVERALFQEAGRIQ